MDKQRSCANKCVFCFIDQLPKGMRPTLYFKDDDARMSFLLGNYISMTNLSEEDVERIIAMAGVAPQRIGAHHESRPPFPHAGQPGGAVRAWVT